MTKFSLTNEYNFIVKNSWNNIKKSQIKSKSIARNDIQLKHYYNSEHFYWGNMRSFIMKFTFIFLCVRESIGIFSVDNYELDVYYPRIDMIIENKICDESTINGTLNYTQSFIDKVNECEQIMDYKVNKTH